MVTPDETETFVVQAHAAHRRKATTTTRRRSVWLSTLTAVALLLVTAWGSPASADPADEDGPPGLKDQLAAAASAYNAASNELAASKKRQADLTALIPQLAKDYEAASVEVNKNAAAMYKGSQAGAISGIIGSPSPSEFIDNAMIIFYLAKKQDNTLHELLTKQAATEAAKRELDAEIPIQQQQLAALEKHKHELEVALGVVGGTTKTSGYGTLAPSATPAPRNADGSWPKESCSVNDPTTSGCITPRTYHALMEAKKAGFNHYVSCYRPGGSGEHPKGRACDFAANANGFAGTATGADRDYGNRLAAWCLANASRLGVLYVIWFRQIWLPGIGWRAYHGDGSPSGDHTNHVHLSME